jgi:RNA polymerase sigma-70 factor (ECF subfamily)
MRRYWFGDSISELAKLFGIRKHAVTARLYRTREKLRKNLMEGGTEL